MHPESASGVRCFQTMVPMRDCIRLNTFVFLPESGGLRYQDRRGRYVSEGEDHIYGDAAAAVAARGALNTPRGRAPGYPALHRFGRLDAPATHRVPGLCHLATLSR